MLEEEAELRKWTRKPAGGRRYHLISSLEATINPDSHHSL
jgi:hypothetical protein